MAQLINFKELKKDFNYYLDELSFLCKSDLESVNTIILEKLNSNIPLVQEIATYLIKSGGKRLRPLLTCCSYKMSNNEKNNQKNHLNLAAAVEFIHAATLLHDDVVDKSKKRRGNLSANEVWGNKSSVLVGDFLFSRAFQLMAKTENMKVLKLLSNTSVIISEGEILELSNDNNPALSEDIYLEVINGKTASLFSAACQVGAMINNVDKAKVEAFKTFGTNFGISFQLIDDAIDYASNLKKLDKNIGDDFKEGKITLPLILAYLRSNDKEKKFWINTIKKLNQKENDFEKAVKIMNKYNCIEDTIKRANHFANIAIDSLGIFEDTKYKKVLIDLVESSFSRFN